MMTAASWSAAKIHPRDRIGLSVEMTRFEGGLETQDKRIIDAPAKRFLEVLDYSEHQHAGNSFGDADLSSAPRRRRAALTDPDLPALAPLRQTMRAPA